MRASDEQVSAYERVSGGVLAVGVSTSAAMLLVGLLVWALGIEAWDTRLLDAGLVLLMATPAARVVVSLAEYMRARDWFFVITACCVLVVLLAGVVAALLHR